MDVLVRNQPNVRYRASSLVHHRPTGWPFCNISEWSGWRGAGDRVQHVHRSSLALGFVLDRGSLCSERRQSVCTFPAVFSAIFCCDRHWVPRCVHRILNTRQLIQVMEAVLEGIVVRSNSWMVVKVVWEVPDTRARYNHQRSPGTPVLAVAALAQSETGLKGVVAQLISWTAVDKERGTTHSACARNTHSCWHCACSAE